MNVGLLANSAPSPWSQHPLLPLGEPSSSTLSACGLTSHPGPELTNWIVATASEVGTSPTQVKENQPWDF